MKIQPIKHLAVLIIVLLFTSCYDRDIIDSKEFNHSIPTVENLQCTNDGNSVKLTWDIPSTIPDDIKRPIEVQIQVVENDIYRQKVTLAEVNPGKATINVDADKKYRFIVKLQGFIKDESRAVGESEKVVSASAIVEK